MEWADAPPTWKQLKYLKQLGYTPHHRLTKKEACELIVKLGGKLDEVKPDAPAFTPPSPQVQAYEFRVAVEKARQTQSNGQSAQALADAMTRRQEYWVDTCREVRQM